MNSSPKINIQKLVYTICTHLQSPQVKAIALCDRKEQTNIFDVY